MAFWIPHCKEENMKKNEIVYHVGYIAVEREEDPRVAVKAEYWMKKYERGLVFLFQRRIGPKTWEYIAVPRR
jgi:hypothetical protein